ncbi:MAG: hypothetical protein KME29_24885 [Calothrix sp. FI2-JRJ7]|jgi:hypothetical protein|nr:hypothetical protein [Calothrix sp. FI2-JRJ7]
MAIPKKGSRLIVVDGEGYRWRVRKKPTHAQGDYPGVHLTVGVEHAENRGANLVVVMPQGHPSSFWTQVIVPVYPADVKCAIERAISAGWQPQKPGKPFELVYKVSK